MSLSKQRVFDEIKHLVEAGVSCHWLKPRSKSPILKKWQEAPFCDLDALDDLHRQDANIGFRPGSFSETPIGFIHVIDFDIRDESKFHEAQEVLRGLLPEYESHPMVQSGSGGSSRHIWFISDRPFSTKKLAKSEGFSMVWDDHKGREVKKYDWEIDLLGSKKNCVLPPSIHPDTGQEYVWLKPFDATCLDLNEGPFVPHETVEGWGGRIEGGDDDDDDLMGVVRNEPIGLEDEKIIKTLADLPEDWVDDRDLWLTVGSALHHEKRGGDDGMQMWAEWSSQSEKYDAEDLERVWRSFTTSKKRPVRMPTLIQAATQHRLERELFGEGEDEDTFAAPVPAPTRAPVTKAQTFIDDLLGDDDLDLTIMLDGDGTNEVDLDEDEEDDLAFLDRVDKETDIERVVKAMPKTEWISELAITEDGAIKSTSTNVQTIVRNDPRTCGVLAYNEFLHRVVRVAQPGQFKRKTPSMKPIKQLDSDVFKRTDDPNGDEWGDEHAHYLRITLEASQGQGGYGIKITDRDLNAAIITTAHDHKFHPIRDFFNDIAEKWDGKKRLDRLLTDYLGCTYDDYHREVGTLILVACVARIFEPGLKFDQIPVIEGPQGIGKSTFCNILAHGWFGEIDIDQFRDAKEAVEAMQGKLLLEVPELSGMSKADMRLVKAFITRQVDRVRLSYERNAKDYARQSIMIGTTNEDDYLRDPTGNRRFWPIRGEHDDQIDTERLRKNLDQLWGEAVHIYRAMRQEKPVGELPLFLQSETARAKALVLQESRRAVTEHEMWAGLIEKWLDDPADEFDDLDGGPKKYRMYVCNSQIWTECLGKSLSETGRNAMARDIAAAMKFVKGWERCDTIVDFGHYGKQRCYKRRWDHPIFNHMHPNAIVPLYAEARSNVNAGIAKVPALPEATVLTEEEYPDLLD